MLDDEKFILVLAEKMLTTKGYEAATFEDAEKFLETMLDTPPDVAIIDYMMPGVNGEQMISKIKSNEALSSLPILIYSAADPVILNNIIKKTGATGYLPKGTKMTDFVARMEDILGWS